MKLPHLLLGIITLSSITTAIPSLTPSASAQCLQSHIGLQVKFGNKEALDQSTQTHEVNQQSDGPCTGNVQSSTAVQVDRDVNRPGHQDQVVDERIQGGSGNGTGINGPTVKSSVVVPIKIQTPDGFNPP